ncbi:MAG: hypothetical protein ACKOA8_08005 [Deltaproteobacteria bacterium]
MKYRSLIFTLIGITLASVGFYFLKPQPKIHLQEESALSMPNSLMPELMGAKKIPTRTNLDPEQIARLKELKKFRVYLESSYLRLPSIESLKLSKEGDFHHVPPTVIESSEIFGDIADRLNKNGYLIRDALKFYSACALNEQLVTSVRAVCARNLKDWSSKAKIDISRIEIPETIQKIADVLPGRN